MKEKKQLTRIVKDGANGLTVDITGKLAGRGAYVCKDVACVEQALKTKGLERSFKQAVSRKVYEDLRLITNEGL